MGEKKKRRKRGFETKREALEFERSTKLSLMFEMLFWTGCRIGELLAITKADINFEKNQLIVRSIMLHILRTLVQNCFCYDILSLKYKKTGVIH